VPTVAETVAPDFDVRAWCALAGPHELLLSPLVARLSEVTRASLAQPVISEKFLHMGSAVTPARAQALLAAEVARWTKVSRDENIPPAN
jgi:tripartite-type tricarboxylate transporter receptor subunit TctC